MLKGTYKVDPDIGTLPRKFAIVLALQLCIRPMGIAVKNGPKMVPTPEEPEFTEVIFLKTAVYIGTTGT